VFAKNVFRLLSSPALHKTHQLFPATGAVEKANRTVNPFPTKTCCRRRSAWVGWLACGDLEGNKPAILMADERDAEVAPPYLGKKYLLSFSVKERDNSVFLFLSLGYTQIAAQRKILLIEAKTTFAETLSLKEYFHFPECVPSL